MVDLVLYVRAFHGVGLSRGCLPICKDLRSTSEFHCDTRIKRRRSSKIPQCLPATPRGCCFWWHILGSPHPTWRNTKKHIRNAKKGQWHASSKKCWNLVWSKSFQALASLPLEKAPERDARARPCGKGFPERVSGKGFRGFFKQ